MISNEICVLVLRLKAKTDILNDKGPKLMKSYSVNVEEIIYLSMSIQIFTQTCQILVDYIEMIMGRLV